MTARGWNVAHCGVGTELGEVQQGQIATDTLGYRLGQLDHRGPLVLASGTSKSGERRYLIDLLEALPQVALKSVLLVCDAGYVGYDLFAVLLKQECSFLIRLSSQAQLYSLKMVKVEGFTKGGSGTGPTMQRERASYRCQYG